MRRWDFFQGMHIFLVTLTFFIIYLPIFIVIILSFHASRINYDSFQFTFKWYGEIVKSRSLMQAIAVTFQLALLSTIISTILGTLFAIGIHGLRKKQRLQMMILNNVPVVNPDIVTGIMLYIVFFFLKRLIVDQLGIIPSHMTFFGFYTMLIAHVFFSIPFVVLTVLPKLKSLDPNLYDAALDLGATKLKAIRKVILPSISIGILTGALIAFTMSIDDFIISYFVSGAVQNVSIYAYSMLPRKTFPIEIYAYNSLIVIITIVIMVGLNRLNRKDKRLKGEKK